MSGPSAHRSPLEPSADEMCRLVDAAMARIIAYTSSLSTQPAYDPRDAHQLAELVDEPMPREPSPIEPVLSLLFERMIPKGVNTASPGSLSYVTGGGIFHAALGTFIAAATNRYVGYWGGAPGLVEIESRVIRWFCDLVGLPPGAGGVLLTGGSMATLTAIVTARARLGESFARGVIYASDQMHHSVEKSALIAGFPSRNVRTIPTDETFRMNVDALARAMAADADAGLVPLCVVATAGTTNTGAIDDLGAVFRAAKVHGSWLHVDASYGGFFLLTDRGRRALAGVDAADSVALDPHKSLFFPFGTGCLLVRDPQALRRAHQVHSDYVASVAAIGDEAGTVNFADLSAEQSREARGLRVWLAIKLLGSDAFRRALDEKLDLAVHAARGVAALPHVEMVAEPQLSILAFRVVVPGMTEEELNALNARVLDTINRPGPVHLSATTVRGRFVIRICVLPFRAHGELIDACVRTIGEAIAEVTSAPPTDAA